jgi:probable FeS assembly SUF system protein SufT
MAHDEVVSAQQLTQPRKVSTDIPAIVVPSGESVVIPKDSEVSITHRLGSSFTLTWEYGMARVSGEYAEALGENPLGKVEEGDDGVWSEEKLWNALKLVYDPEIPVDIVNLGLIYSLETSKDIAPEVKGQDLYHVFVKMTLTAPGCGMGPAIAADARERLLQVRGVADAQVDIVWDPPWTQEMISEEGKMILGLV